MATTLEAAVVQRRGSSPARRIHFLDNLRSFIILLVILYHAGVVYESSGIGAIFWVVDDPATSDLVGLVNLTLDIFVMATLFFISGYLSPMSMENRSAGAFLMGKARRLMLPWMVAALTLMPLYKVIFLGSRGLPQEDWTRYFHFSNGILSQSWLWFLPVLFLFDVAYVLLRRPGWLPRQLSVKPTIIAMLVIGFFTSLAMDMLGLQGWTKNAFINFQNERLPLYFMTFLAGSLCYHQQVFASRPGGIARYLAVGCTAWIPLTGYIFLVLVSILAPGKFIVSPLVDRMLLWLCFYLSLVALLYLSIETFRRYVDRTGHMWHELNRNSYYVYIIHVVVMGAVAWVLLGIPLPSFAKYLILTAATWLACNVLISGWRSLVVFGQPDPLASRSAPGVGH